MWPRKKESSQTRAMSSREQMQRKVTTNISSLLTTQTINMTEEGQDDQDLQNRELHHGKMKFEETWNVNQRRKGSCWTRHVTSGKHMWRDLRRAYLRHTQLELLTIEHSNSGLFWMWACPENKYLYTENNTESRVVISPWFNRYGTCRASVLNLSYPKHCTKNSIYKMPLHSNMSVHAQNLPGIENIWGKAG